MKQIYTFTPKCNTIYNDVSFILFALFGKNFNLIDSESNNITGTKIKVNKVANNNPKIIVHDKGPQKATLSPPKKICGLPSVNKVTKSIYQPFQIT